MTALLAGLLPLVAVLAAGLPAARARAHLVLAAGAAVGALLALASAPGEGGAPLLGGYLVDDALARLFLAVDGAVLLGVALHVRGRALASPHLAQGLPRFVVFAGLFMAIAEEMGEALRRSAASVNIRERLDFSCAVFDRAGNLIANAPHIPVHLGAMGETVRQIIADNPDLRPGDVFVTNDPYRGGSHLPDVTVVTPVHDETRMARGQVPISSTAKSAFSLDSLRRKTPIKRFFPPKKRSPTRSQGAPDCAVRPQDSRQTRFS